MKINVYENLEKKRVDLVSLSSENAAEELYLKHSFPNNWERRILDGKLQIYVVMENPTMKVRGS